jgi:two-component system, NarL family, response regulator
MLTPLRLIIADDHALFRQGLRSLLLLHPEVRVVAEVEGSAGLAQTVSAIPCDILLLDLQMDRLVLEEIEPLTRLTTVVVLTASENPEQLTRALRLGARGIVQKRFAIESLMEALKTVARGQVWIPSSVQTELTTLLTNSSDKRLTFREAEIVRYVSTGLRNAEIAERLAISESTVKTHLNNIFQKLGVRNRIQLMHYAIRVGIVS